MLGLIIGLLFFGFAFLFDMCFKVFLSLIVAATGLQGMGCSSNSNNFSSTLQIRDAL